MDFIKRRRLLFGVLSFVFMVLPGAIESAWSLAERILGENIIMPEISVVWFTWFTVPIGLLMLAIIIYQGRRSKIAKQGDSLQIEVQTCVVHNFIPQSEYTLDKHMSTVEVKAKFSPQGKMKLHSLELHIGRHTFDADRLPILFLGREDTYTTGFKVPCWVVTTALKKSDTGYIRALAGGGDWRSNEFTFSFA